jgi:hypothetical protein
MGCELQLQDDVRSAKAEKQQLLRFDGAAAKEIDRRGWLYARGKSRQRAIRSWIEEQLGVWRRSCYVQIESRENALTRSRGSRSLALFLMDRQDRYTCTQTHPVSS